jgi:hypothetical protein
MKDHTVVQPGMKRVLKKEDFNCSWKKPVEDLNMDQDLEVLNMDLRVPLNLLEKGMKSTISPWGAELNCVVPRVSYKKLILYGVLSNLFF